MFTISYNLLTLLFYDRYRSRKHTGRRSHTRTHTISISTAAPLCPKHCLSLSLLFTPTTNSFQMQASLLYHFLMVLYNLCIFMYFCKAYSPTNRNNFLVCLTFLDFDLFLLLLISFFFRYSHTLLQRNGIFFYSSMTFKWIHHSPSLWYLFFIFLQVGLCRIHLTTKMTNKRICMFDSIFSDVCRNNTGLVVCRWCVCEILQIEIDKCFDQTEETQLE